MDYVKQVPRKVKIKEGKVIKRKQKNTMAIQLFEESVYVYKGQESEYVHLRMFG